MGTTNTSGIHVHTLKANGGKNTPILSNLRNYQRAGPAYGPDDWCDGPGTPH